MPSNEQIADLLNTVDVTQPLGSKLHSAVMRVSPSTAIEAVALRRTSRGTEVLLRQRGMEEAAYPGQFHCPGSHLRDGETVPDVFGRLSTAEFLGTVVRHEFVGEHTWRDERGWIISLIYLVDVLDVYFPKISWHPVASLPHPMVKEHASVMIPMALGRFKERR